MYSNNSNYNSSVMSIWMNKRGTSQCNTAYLHHLMAKKTSRSPTTTFLSYIQKLLVDSEGMLTPATILETAQWQNMEKPVVAKHNSRAMMMMTLYGHYYAMHVVSSNTIPQVSGRTHLEKMRFQLYWTQSITELKTIMCVLLSSDMHQELFKLCLWIGWNRTEIIIVNTHIHCKT